MPLLFRMYSTLVDKISPKQMEAQWLQEIGSFYYKCDNVIDKK